MDPTEVKNSLWRVNGHVDFDGLSYEQDIPLESVSDHDCLVKIEAASLNFRDLMVAQGSYPFPMASGVVPGSDGAGIVLEVGKKVTRFQKGDKVCTTLNQRHIAGSLTASAANTGLGASLDGTFRLFGVFDEEGLVGMPHTLSFREASSLPCAAVTAWNALYGLPGKSLKPGDTVLTLGSGSVSLFAIQFASLAGATVISTTSGDSKADKLKALGATHVINYKEDVSWGRTAKARSPRGDGVDFIIEVGGATTLSQSVAAVKVDGLIAVVGSVGSDVSAKGDPGMLSAWTSNCLMGGIAVGHRGLFEDMIQAIDAKHMKPVIDERVFKLTQLKEAYQYMWEQQNFGKVVIEC